nr:hypothetical protein [Legionella jordanis]
MSKYDIDKAYVSPYDKFFHGFDTKHKPSESQLKEIKKYERIFRLRDNPNSKVEDGEIWEGF